jgi:hypothetical protein
LRIASIKLRAACASSAARAARRRSGGCAELHLQLGEGGHEVRAGISQRLAGQLLARLALGGEKKSVQDRETGGKIAVK